MDPAIKRLLDSSVEQLRFQTPTPADEPARSAFSLPLCDEGAPIPDFGVSVSLGEIDGRRARMLTAGRPISAPIVAITDHHKAFLSFAGSGELAIVKLQARSGLAQTWITVISTALPPPRGKVKEIEISLSEFAGSSVEFQLVVDGEGSLCYLLEFIVCDELRVGYMRGFTDYRARLENEIRHYAGGVYDHPMYGQRPDLVPGASSVMIDVTRGFRKLLTPITDCQQEALERLDSVLPLSSETAFEYGLRALTALLPTDPPHFGGSLKYSPTEPIRVLSICSGAARVEAQMLSGYEGPVHITLLDANRELLQVAASRLSSLRSGIAVECLVGDINDGIPGDDQYDVIVCVSALHHVVHLEEVLLQANERLRDHGEFWSIGEQIGRNGNRLWPDALRAANRVFAKLPARLRLNARTGHSDLELSDRDFSVGCFEGVRSEEIDDLLERYLVPLHVYKRNAFLWRLIDSTYSDNYDLGRHEDLQWLRLLVAAEFAHWTAGGRSTELHGVYRKKKLRATTPNG